MKLFIRIRFAFTLLITFFSLAGYAQSGASVLLGQMVKQTMKESWADVEPLGKDDQGVLPGCILFTRRLSPMIADEDFLSFFG